MIYSYTQIIQYLTCPRRYRHRYLDGWKEKDTRAAMLFGRAFEQALGAHFRREDPGAILFQEWSAYKDQGLHFSNHETWDRMLEQGIMLLTRFCQDDRVQIDQPRRNLQVKFTRPIERNEFVAYIDGIGKLDGTRCLLEWKTSASRYSEEPEGLLALDPQLVCYSWMTRISEVAQVVFVRKRLVEVQYLRTTITDQQRQEFGQLAEEQVIFTAKSEVQRSGVVGGLVSPTSFCSPREGGSAASCGTTPPLRPAVACAPGTDSPARMSQTVGLHSYPIRDSAP